MAEQGPTILECAPDRIVAIIGAKLIGLDSILPVMWELKNENPGLNIDFLFLSEKTLAEIAGNYVLMRGVRQAGKIHVLSSSSGTLRSKLSAAFRLILWVIRLVAGRNLLLGYSDFGQFPLNALAFGARQRGFVLNYIKASFVVEQSFRDEIAKNLRKETPRFKDQSNPCIIYLPSQINDMEQFSSAGSIVIGTPRQFPCWKQFIQDIHEHEGIVTREGRRIEVSSGTVFVFFYPGNHNLPHLATPTSCQDQFVTFLRVLEQEAPGSHVIIKPHVICNMSELDGVLQQFQRLRIDVTEAHPSLLAKFATVAVFANSSNVINDMYIEGIPVLELSDYNEYIKTQYETEHPNVGRIGAVSESDIRNAILQIINRPGELLKPDREDVYWPKPRSVSWTIWGQ